MASKLLNVRIPSELQKELEKVSRDEHIPLSELVRQSLREFLVSMQLKRIRKELMPYARQKGVLTDEDVFKALS